ncbi:MAG: hypothetical protein MUE67_00850 [Anaerolineales bacterium]|jgi:hypothetical protein|nr:hypothetical protein [Anaerolineales bacterium]
MAVFSPDPETESVSQKQRMLQTHHIEMIEEALRSVGEYGEVRLVVEKGKLRFLITQKSVDALKWQPGSLDTKP